MLATTAGYFSHLDVLREKIRGDNSDYTMETCILYFEFEDFRANQWKSSCPKLKTDAVSFTKSQITKCQSPWLLSPSASTRPAIMIEKNLPSDRRNGLSGVPLTEMHWRVSHGAVKITAPRYQLSAIGSCQNDPKAILSAIGASFPWAAQR